MLSLKEALDQPDPPNLALLLQSCTCPTHAELLHLQIARCGKDHETFLGNSLIQMYGRLGNVDRAKTAFDKIANKNSYSWNLLISAFADNGHLERAQFFLQKMPHKDACSWTTMLAAFARNGLVVQAREMFDSMPQRDLVAWNSMISAYAQNGHSWQAIFLHRIMSLEGIKPDELTIISLLSACSVEASPSPLLREAKMIHSTIIRHSGNLSASVKVSNALIHLYGSSKLLPEAIDIFRSMPRPDCISWTSIIAAQNVAGDARAALVTFRSMELHGVKSSSVTMIEVMNACGTAGSIAEGCELHARAVAAGWFPREMNVANAVLNMYARCGNLVRAREVFREVAGRDLATWNTMLAAFARNGAGDEALELFQRMKVEGIQPDGITVVCIVSACSHSGLARHGLRCIASIYGDFGVEATSEHINCVVDLLGRIGSVDEAGELDPVDEVGARTMLGACRVQGGGGAGVSFPSRASSSESYVTISNIFAWNV